MKGERLSTKVNHQPNVSNAENISGNAISLPSVDPFPVQRKEYYLATRNSKGESSKFRRKVEDAIKAQTIKVDSLNKLYVAPPENEKWETAPETMRAYTSGDKEHPHEINRQPENFKPARKVFDKISLPFKSDTVVYHINVVTDPDVLLDSDSDVKKVIDERIKPPFNVLKLSAPLENKSSMGRVYKRQTFWMVNDASTFDLHGYTKDQSKAKFLVERYGLSEENMLKDADPKYKALKTDGDSPVKFFVLESDYLNDKAVDKNNFHKHIERRIWDEEKFDEMFNASDEDKKKEMSDPSKMPSIDRKVSDRKPQEAMDGPASLRAFSKYTYPTIHITGARTSHEWCHLIGDGDNGPAEAPNLMAGTHQVNTEQLAMEKALRFYRLFLEKHGKKIRLHVKAIGKKIDVSDFDTKLKKLEADEKRIGEQIEKKPSEKKLGILKNELIDIQHEIERMRGYKEDKTTYAKDQAEFIKYEISIVDAKTPDTIEIPVHTQVMDAERGVITRDEFVYLGSLIQEKFRKIRDDYNRKDDKTEEEKKALLSKKKDLLEKKKADKRKIADLELKKSKKQKTIPDQKVVQKKTWKQLPDDDVYESEGQEEEDETLQPAIDMLEETIAAIDEELLEADEISHKLFGKVQTDDAITALEKEINVIDKEIMDIVNANIELLEVNEPEVESVPKTEKTEQPLQVPKSTHDKEIKEESSLPETRTQVKTVKGDDSGNKENVENSSKRKPTKNPKNPGKSFG